MERDEECLKRRKFESVSREGCRKKGVQDRVKVLWKFAQCTKEICDMFTARLETRVNAFQNSPRRITTEDVYKPEMKLNVR